MFQFFTNLNYKIADFHNMQIAAEGLQLVEHAAGHGPAPTAPGLVRIENLPLPRRLKVCGWRLVHSTIGNFWAQSECLVGSGYNDLMSSLIEI